MDTFFLFLTLCMLELILGVDNIIAFSLLVQQAPSQSHKKVKIIGLAGAFFLRALFAVSVLSLQNMDSDLTASGFHLSLNNILFLIGGVFLIYKSLLEMRDTKKTIAQSDVKEAKSVLSIIWSIIFIDIVFAVDSVLVAVAITQNYAIIVSAILASMFFMYRISDYVIFYMMHSSRIKILGVLLVFIIGLFLLLKGCGIHLDQELIIAIVFFGCIYEALIAYIERNRS